MVKLLGFWRAALCRFALMSPGDRVAPKSSTLRHRHPIDHREQLVEIIWLGHKGHVFEVARQWGVSIDGRHADHRHTAELLVAQLVRSKLCAIHDGHMEIEQYHTRSRRTSRVQSFETIASRNDVISGAGQHVTQ